MQTAPAIAHSSRAQDARHESKALTRTIAANPQHLGRQELSAAAVQVTLAPHPMRKTLATPALMICQLVRSGEFLRNFWPYRYLHQRLDRRNQMNLHRGNYSLLHEWLLRVSASNTLLALNSFKYPASQNAKQRIQEVSFRRKLPLTHPDSWYNADPARQSE